MIVLVDAALFYPFNYRTLSIMSFYVNSDTNSTHASYEVVRGIEKERSIRLLQRFYDRENEKAPDNKRRKK